MDRAPADSKGRSRRPNFCDDWLCGRSAQAVQNGQNLQIDFRWTLSDADRVRKYAAELVAVAPDVIVTGGSSHLGPLPRRKLPAHFLHKSLIRESKRIADALFVPK
jgi:hypothetical protein